MTDDRTHFTIQRDVRPGSNFPHNLRWSNGHVDILNHWQADYLEALQANATVPQGDYAALRADLVALRNDTRTPISTTVRLTAILDAHPPLDLPDGFELTPTADAAAALAAVRTGKWTALFGNGDEVGESHLVWCVGNHRDARFHMRPVTPPPMVEVTVQVPVDASDEQIVAAFRAQDGA